MVDMPEKEVTIISSITTISRGLQQQLKTILLTASFHRMPTTGHKPMRPVYGEYSMYQETISMIAVLS